MEGKNTVLAVGIKVKIKRSDGRVHNATVSGINSESSLVSVEWYEGDETKGKEIELRQVLYLNPNVTNKPISAEPRPLLLVQSKLQPPRRQTHYGSPHPNSGIPKPRLRNVENIINSKPPAAPPTQVPSDEQQPHPPQHNLASVSRSKSIGSLSSEAGVNGREQPEVSDKVVLRSKTNSKDKAAANANRRSQVVKEVDVIKKKRDERRVKNAELRQKKNQDFDPDNPNWEFVAMVKEFRLGINISPLRSCGDVPNNRICVCVRKRPLSKKELNKKETDIVTIPEQSLTMVHEPKTKVDLTKYLEHHNFRFDYSFDETSTNEMIYHYTAKPLVSTIFDGGMATCFAYGQTGSGKTHTMGGSFNGKEQDSTKGIYALAAGDVFRLNRVSHESLGLSVSASYFEIYCSKVFDLLNGKKRLRILEDAKSQVQVVGLEEVGVSSVSDVLQLIETGNAIRTSGTTSANQNSSRSHAVFQLILRKKSSRKLFGKLSLIDLAGNERGADTSSSDRKTRLEGAEINKSLLALKECIRALGRKGAHLPFRGSTLTQVLRDSFIGSKAKTCMISTISPGLNCCEHTLNTLRYAERVKELPGKKKNVQLMQQPAAEEGNSVSNYVAREDDPMIGNDDDLIINEVDPMDGLDDFERSSELRNLHHVIAQMNELEEMIFASHREIIMDSKDEENLLTEAESVDGNSEEYANKMIEIVEEKIAKLEIFKGHLISYKQLSEQEATASQSLKNARQ